MEIDFDKIIKIVKKVNKLNICQNRGLNNPRVAERQFLYGDILDYLRDYYSTELSLDERDVAAKLIIGEYVVQNTLL